MAMFSITKFRHYLSAYHIANIILCSSFLVTRTIRPFCNVLFPKKNPELPVCQISWGETNILLFLVCVLVLKSRRRPPFQEYIVTVFSFTKVANVVLFFQADPRLTLLFSVACVVVLVLFPEPAYTGPHNLTYFEGNTLEEELKNNPRTTWLVEFYANWSSECLAFAGTFAQLSVDYDHSRLKFGKVDAGRYPELAKKFGVETSALCKQMPSVVLYQNGKEVSRKPGKNSKGQTVKYNFTKENIVRDFDLNNLYETTKSKAQKKAESKREEEKEEEKKTR